MPLSLDMNDETKHIKQRSFLSFITKNGKRKFQGVPQSQAAAFPRHQVEEETDKTKQAIINQTYKKH